MNAQMEPPHKFELPDTVADWDDQQYFTFLQDHQFAYQGKLEQLKAEGKQETEEYRHCLTQFELVETYMAGDFNRRYYQG